ncbi:hypothetical protein GQX74_014988 [Glossina fuscipes]|nr:hypothetical protein GQX74_014988 [Glossina fuscipes]
MFIGRTYDVNEQQFPTSCNYLANDSGTLMAPKSTMKIVYNAMKLVNGNPYQHYFYLYTFSPPFTGWPLFEPNRLITAFSSFTTQPGNLYSEYCLTKQLARSSKPYSDMVSHQEHQEWYRYDLSISAFQHFYANTNLAVDRDSSFYALD